MAWRGHPAGPGSRGLVSTSASRLLSSYEISDDLNRRHVQCLERKYGGRLRAHSAATKIQRAFRLYKLQRQFRSALQRDSYPSNCASPRGNFQEQDSTVFGSSLNENLALLRTNIGTVSQPSLKYQPVNSLRAQLMAERGSNGQGSSTAFSPRKGSTPNAHDSHNESTLNNSSNSQRGFAELMSPRLSKRNGFGSPFSVGSSSPSTTTSNGRIASPRCVGGTSPSIWVPQLRPASNDHFRTPSPPPISLHQQHHVHIQQQHQSRLNTSFGLDSPILSGHFTGQMHHQQHQVHIHQQHGSHHVVNHTNSLPRLDCRRKTPQQLKNIATPPMDGRAGMSIGGMDPTGVVLQNRRQLMNETSPPCSTEASSSSAALSTSSDHHHIHHNNSSQTGHRLNSHHYHTHHTNPPTPADKAKEKKRRRMYRIALNFFNKKPDRGIRLLIDWGFVDEDPREIALFFIERRGLGKQMIGEFLGTLRSPFHAAILESVLNEIPMHQRDIDVALREMLHHFRLPSEAQKIDYVMQLFAKRYRDCNSDRLPPSVTVDAIYVLAFATIMLNTDLHSPSMKVPRKMTVEEFVKNTWGAEDSRFIDRESLVGVYDRVRETEIRSGSDHVTQVLKVDQSIVGKDKPLLVEQHRRLICYCRLNQVLDANKKQTPTAHQREVFLFNDLILVTKNANKRRGGAIQYMLRLWSPLIGVNVAEFENSLYQNGLQIDLPSGQSLLFNAKNSDDRVRFMADVKESVAESTEMEQLRLKFELDKQRDHHETASAVSSCRITSGSGGGGRLSRSDSQRDSGLPDLDQPSPVLSSSHNSSTFTSQHTPTSLSTDSNGSTGSASLVSNVGDTT